MPVTTSLLSSPSWRRAAPLAPMMAAALAAALAWLPAAASAQATYEPSVGQAGKDVVWVPTSQALVERMLDIAKVQKTDYLIDLGSGDGRTVITAAKRGLTAHGIEYNPDMTEVARRAAAKEGVAERASFATGDLFEADLSRAQVITMFLLPSINERLRPVLLDLKPGTRVVSNTFRMGDWQPDETATIEQDCQNWCTALLWVVPAKVEGLWKLGDRQLTLSQQYQMLSGTLGQTPITDARMKGNEISFNVDGVRYTGTVDGKRMSGKGGSQGNWTATRT
ncbi:methyltransferase [Bordetella ansorpii]|uniref:Methyltransferase n=1 Tax=Bordetella ansorpii TaxID=288768 RepID=A0A157MSP3_9BORD|nr:class I SAM-dependent methyltransferase [Bordetella ansorpii]SAI12087.1 methyltransferase [Bordetella ansorpii]